jgi:hypothetical protein
MVANSAALVSHHITSCSEFLTVIPPRPPGMTDQAAPFAFRPAAKPRRDCSSRGDTEYLVLVRSHERNDTMMGLCFSLISENAAEPRSTVDEVECQSHHIFIEKVQRLCCSCSFPVLQSRLDIERSHILPPPARPLDSIPAFPSFLPSFLPSLF